jgi:hypothetical protein
MAHAAEPVAPGEDTRMKQRLTEETLKELALTCAGQFRPNAGGGDAPIPPRLPEEPGVYAITIEHEVIYFGQAADLNKRMRDYRRSPFVDSAQPAQKRIGEAVIAGKTASVWFAVIQSTIWEGLLVYPAIAVEAAVMREYAKPPSNRTWLPPRSKPDDRPVRRL